VGARPALARQTGAHNSRYASTPAGSTDPACPTVQPYRPSRPRPRVEARAGKVAMSLSDANV